VIADQRRRTLDLLSRWVAIPSVAGNADALRIMAHAVTVFLRDRLGARIVTAGQLCDPPIVHARIDRGHDRTILLYNMYDVMPATPQGWSVPPFDGGIVDLPGLGPSFVGRGAENNKGPLAGMLVVLEDLLARDGLPANVEILIEGQEETGSPLLRRYLCDPETPVRRGRAALFPSFCEYGGGPPRVYLGSKGIAHGVIRAANGPARPIHSSNSPWMVNPAWSLVSALTTMTAGPNGFIGRIDLPDDARPVLTALAEAFDPALELRFRHAQDFALAGSTRERLEAVLTTASLNLTRISTMPQDGRAVIPTLAEARFDLRLPPGMDPRTALPGLPDGLELVVEDAYPGHRFPASAPGVAELCDLYRAAGVAPQIWPWAIGAMPAYAFAHVADSFLIGGLGHGGNAHGPNEFVTLAGLDRYLSFLAAWLPATARALSSQEHACEL
jgi:acetylornithine deacetylase/succinyl-diaminopimelate desuccinylase-like protein